MTLFSTDAKDGAHAAIHASGSPRRARRAGLDGLRVLICGAIILAHALLIFAAEPRYHLKSDEPLLIASILYEFMRATTMATFFVLAGWSAQMSFRGRGVARFAWERVIRLLPPLVVGTLLFGSIIKYIELRHGRDLSMSGLRLVEPLTSGFFDFFPGNLRRIKQMTWSHLWFLAYLFLISFVMLPLLMWLSRRKPVAAVPAVFAAYLPGVGLALLLLVLGGYWPFLPNLVTDWSNFAYFTVCFAIGAVIAIWPGLETRLGAEAGRLLMLMLVAFAGLVICGESAAGRLFVGLTAWGAIGAGFGYAARSESPETPLLAYLSEATLPVYIVHHAPILLLGHVLLPLALPPAVTIVTLWLVTTVISLAIYHWLIRPWNPVRRAMGMSPLPPRPQVHSAGLRPQRSD